FRRVFAALDLDTEELVCTFRPTASEYLLLRWMLGFAAELPSVSEAVGLKVNTSSSVSRSKAAKTRRNKSIFELVSLLTKTPRLGSTTRIPRSPWCSAGEVVSSGSDAANSRSIARFCSKRILMTFGVRFAQSVTVSDTSPNSYAVTTLPRNEVSSPSGSVGRTTSGGRKSVSKNVQYLRAC